MVKPCADWHFLSFFHLLRGLAAKVEQAIAVTVPTLPLGSLVGSTEAVSWQRGMTWAMCSAIDPNSHVILNSNCMLETWPLFLSP